MTDRIHWRCGCTNVLSAPTEWQGREVHCPSCGAPTPVPATSEPDVEALAAASEIPFRERRVAAGLIPPQGSPYSGWELRTEGGPPPDDPFFQQFRSDPHAVRRASRRKWWVLALILAILGVLAGGALTWRHLWKTRWSVEARMENAGFGHRVTSVRAGPWQEALGAVARAQQRVESPDDGIEAATALRDAFLLALKEAEGMPRRQRARLYNNAAWFLATTPHAGIREPARALDLAESAVELTGRRDAGVLDTLAEALFVNDRAAAAAEVEDEAIARDLGNEHFRQQDRKFHAAAGLPLPIHPPYPASAPSAPSSDDSVPADR